MDKKGTRSSAWRKLDYSASPLFITISIMFLVFDLNIMVHA